MNATIETKVKRVEKHVGVYVDDPSTCVIYSKVGIAGRFPKFSSTEFHKHPFSSSRAGRSGD
jgi:hypothetical protein